MKLTLLVLAGFNGTPGRDVAVVVEAALAPLIGVGDSS